ncbi:LysR family transcriptional regulator [Marinomonas fungiae]|uniref:Bacterial regulatory helix-turn-helix protein, lysR family n=1 Tax=Marinomonas fungiae TaxID=1137284 RepID=A0A0K6IH42_9GAMM|nr:LysR family transcriptional regulator [Marinomonas fungiae]CUB02465.1 Bacterial regulatory helix-turn-helix protein, lysR family [Marinomonas fungiae]
MLNTQHLITFRTLVETGSFTQTARKLGLTQPAVSQHIQKLEKGLGEPLLIRHGRSTELTEAGEVLYRHVQDLGNCYEEFVNQWQSYVAHKEAAHPSRKSA